MDTTVQQVQQTILAGGRIDKKTAVTLLHAERNDLYRAADTIRRHFRGNRFDLCSIINAKSGNCTENCRFCAQSARHHTGIDTYTLIADEEALAMAADNEKHGVHRISLVTSGRNLSPQTGAELTRLYEQMATTTSMRFCASAGLLNEETASLLRAAGVSRYHCNLEASRKFFPQVCTTHTWEEKVETLELARRMGMALCSGGIIGMGETMEDRLDMAFELRELGVKSIPINILTPIEGTPLAQLPPLSLEEALTTVALFRCINPDAVIRMAGGRQQLGDDQYQCFAAGANGAIVGDYLTTTGSTVAEDLQRLAAMGFTFARG
jgi:biotin synthase